LKKEKEVRNFLEKGSLWEKAKREGKDNGESIFDLSS